MNHQKLEIHAIESVVETAKEVLEEKELIESGHHKKLEKFVLLLRNLAVLGAVILMLTSLAHSPMYETFRAWGYLSGMLAYISELVLLTDCFTKKIASSEGFMAYCFGPLYFIMAISYLIE